MSIAVPEDIAEAALRAASKSGYKSTVQELLNLGVKASSMEGVAAVIADFYGHTEIADLLRTAISKEKITSGGSTPSPS